MSVGNAIDWCIYTEFWIVDDIVGFVSTGNAVVLCEL